MPLSEDPDARARQLANLKPGAGAWKSGAAPALRHGLRSSRPPAIVLDPVVRELEDALAPDLPLKEDGDVPRADRYSVELAALQLVRVRRGAAYLALHGDIDEHGRMRPEVQQLERSIDRAAKHLDRLGMNPRARLQLGLDLARSVTAEEALRDHLDRTYGKGGAA